MKKTVLSWFLVFLWMFLIFYLSSIPNLSSGLESDFILRKLAHIFVYFVLFVLFVKAFLNTSRFEYMPIKKILKMAFMFSFLYSLSDEYHQTFVFGRVGSIKDVFIDFVGIVLAWIFVYKYKIFKKHKQKTNF